MTMTAVAAVRDARRRIGPVAALALLVVSSCGGRAGETISAGALKALRAQPIAVVVTIPGRIAWQDEAEASGVISLRDLAPRVAAAWAASIEKALRDRGLKIYPATLAAATGARGTEITAADFVIRERDLIVLETEDRARPTPANGYGTMFLARPLVRSPGGRLGAALDRPLLYDFRLLPGKGVAAVVAVDLAGLTLVQQPDGTTRAGGAVVSVAVLDLAAYRVLARARVEKPRADRRDWLFGNIRGASVVRLRRGEADLLAPALEAAAGRVPDLVLWTLGLLRTEIYRAHERAWETDGGPRPS
jgi:hypothetical protein